MKNTKEKEDNNLGLSLLRFVMCFCVVLLHYWSDETRPIWSIPLAKIAGYAVPVFMFMSFYLTQRAFYEEI